MQLPAFLSLLGGLTLIGWLALDQEAMETGEIDSAPAKASKASGNPQEEDVPKEDAVKEDSSKKSAATFTIEEVRKHDQRGDCWIVIEDRVYDATKFALEHPGGALVIWDVAGRDATDHFLAFHPRGTEYKLRPLLKGSLVDYSVSEVVREFRELRQRMQDLGLFEIHRGFFVRKFVAFMLLLLGAVLCAHTSGTAGCTHPMAWTLAGGVLLGFFFQQLAGIGHDVGHNSVVHYTFCDRLLGLVVGNLLTGISIGWWKKSHNIHHTVPNSVDYDPDIQHLPILAVTEHFFANVFSKYHDWTLRFGSVEQFIVGYQHFLFVPVMAVARFNLYIQSLLFLAGFNSKTHSVRWRIGELISLVGFYIWMTWLHTLLPSIAHVLVFLFVSHAIAGLLHIQITISHFSMDFYNGVTFQNDSQSWCQTQLATTMDVDCPEWLDWFHIGLQFQVEHHLFPRLPRHNLRTVQGLIKPFCKKHGLRHHDVPWFQAIGETLSQLRRVARLARESDPADVKFKDSILYAGLQAEG
jgi:delta8-fatty-acid desaturase